MHLQNSTAASGPLASDGGKGNRLIAALIAAATLVLLVATLNDYGMAWDEGFTVEREERLQEWFARVLGRPDHRNRAWSPTYSKLERRSDYLRSAGAAADSPWSRESLRFYWQFAREEPSGHPPFYALLGLAGWVVSQPFMAPPGSYRFGPAFLFAVTVGVVYLTMARSYGRAAGGMAALGLLTMPRLFAHAHLASYDVPTLCLWFLAVAAFLRACEPTATATGEKEARAWPWTIAFGVAWGCAMATKLTGWFLPFPLIAWALVYRDWRAARTLAIGGLVAILVLYAQIPTWWAEPLSGVQRFLKANLTRQELAPLPTLFLGQVYPFSLPWYNSLFWTAIVVPPLTLGLACLGIGRVLGGRFRDRLGTLLLANWVFLIVLRALPNAPGHDGARLFLPAFVFLACLAGLGLAWVGDGLRKVAGRRLGGALAALVLGIALASGAWSTWRYHPLQLSYYNSLIGGLSGASKAGMEPTYYWDALTPDVRDWINAHSEPGDSVALVFPAVTFEYLHRWGLLRPNPVATVADAPRWFVVMNRPGLLSIPQTLGQALLDHSEPVFVKRLDEAPEVPLIAIYSGQEAFAAELIRRRSSPRRSQPNDQSPSPPKATKPNPETTRPSRNEAGRNR